MSMEGRWKCIWVWAESNTLNNSQGISEVVRQAVQAALGWLEGDRHRSSVRRCDNLLLQLPPQLGEVTVILLVQSDVCGGLLLT